MTYLSFPRQHARTQRFTLGAPRGFVVAPSGGAPQDGSREGADRAAAGRVVFTRARSGAQAEHLLWVLDVATGRERVAADPAVLLGGAEEDLPAAERARRERSREGSAGIVAFAVDRAVSVAAFALSGRLFTASLEGPAGEGAPAGAAGPGEAHGARELAVPGPVIDPRPSPDGRRVAYVSGRSLRVVDADGTGDRALAEPGDPVEGPDGSGGAAGADGGAATDGGAAATVSWGLAEFVAAEEMSRSRGFWWAPDGSALLAARVDEAPVREVWIAQPAHPDRAPAAVRYPLAGTDNAEVTLHLLGLDGSRREIRWDRERYPYLARVHWSAGGPPLLLVVSRDQRETRYLAVDLEKGATATVAVDEDRIWLDLFGGVPAWTPAGELVRIVDEEPPGGSGEARVLKVGERTLTGPELHVRAVLDVSGPGILVTASAGAAAADPEIGEVHVYRVDEAGAVRVSAEPGVHTAVRAGGLTVLTSAVLERSGTRTRVLREAGQDAGAAGDAGQSTEAAGQGAGAGAGAQDPRQDPGAAAQDPEQDAGTRAHAGDLTYSGEIAVIASHAETPSLTARPVLTEAGERRIPAAVLLPEGYREGDGPLPVLLDPYGGPHGQRVVRAHNAHLVSQWFADQGFAVIVADGRGTPGRSPAWEKAVAFELAAVSLEDQVDALHALAGEYPLDLARVAIRGWSFGGYLAANAVLRRPDVFRAGVVGAPVTDLRLYDTYYQERYLGHPAERPEVYERNSLISDAGLVGAAEPARPMMIIHGLADDNVLVAHSLRLSTALLAAGRPHEVLPLSGVTHMTPQEQVAENLLLLQVDFLKRSLGL
jgi:dipeptidyl-peptidase-4